MPPFFRTLRFRIAFAFFLWTGFIQLALTLLMPVARNIFILEQLDARLDRVGHSLAHAAADQATHLDDLISPNGGSEQDPSQIMIVLRDRRGAVMGASSGIAGALPPLPDEESILRGNAHTLIYRTAPGRDRAERIRTATYPVASSGIGVAYIQAAVSLDPADRMTANTQRFLYGGLVVGLISSAAAGWLLSAIIVSRINRIAQAIRTVSPTRLEERINLPEGSDEIGQMASDVNLMLERMAVAFRSQERFMSEVSHEIKTPLSAILTEAQVLKQMRAASQPPTNGTPSSEPSRREADPYGRFILSVEEEMRWLGKLVESFLMLARFGHGKQFVSESLVSVNEVILNSVEHCSLYARQHGVTLALTLHDPGESRPEALVRGDFELLRVVADNLIRNAVQFSKKGDTVAVRLEFDANDAGGITLTVTDHGPGVPQEYLTRIFDRFAQAPGKHSTRRGSGLGLTIAKSIVDLHGGSIDARNLPEGGCVFRVRLPAVPSRVNHGDSANPPKN